MTVDRRQPVAQLLGQDPVAIDDRGVLERLAQWLAGLGAQMSGGHRSVTAS